MAETSSLEKNATELHEVRQSDDIEREAEAAHHIDRKDIHVSAHAELYREALERYPTDESIDRVAEKKLVRKLDWRIIPLLGVCYFFYVRSQARSRRSLISLAVADLLPSMSTRRHFLTLPSMVSRKISTSRATITVGCHLFVRL